MFQRFTLTPVLLPAVLLLFLSGMLHAAPNQQQWQHLNMQLAEHHVLPRYLKLADSSDQLSNSVRALCAEPNKDQLQQAQSDFHTTMDAWQGIQHVQFGPVEFLMRNFSLQFWPDKKNLTRKQLNILLTEQNPETLTPGYFRAASIAVKGLPALERLLFSDTPMTGYRCQLTQAIAQNVYTMSREVSHEWQQQQVQRFADAPNGNGFYEDSREAATELMKSLVEPVEVIRDLKLLRPMHKGVNRAKPRRAESWRSERSLHNIQLNLSALQALYQGTAEISVKSLLIAEGQETLAMQIDQAFTAINQQLNLIELPLYKAVKDLDSHQQLRDISQQMKQLHQQLEQAMQHLNIQLGFNSRDGD